MKACNYYTEEKKNEVNPRVDWPHTLNQCLEFREELLKAILKENGYDEIEIY